jgi:hypothetical protein
MAGEDTQQAGWGRLELSIIRALCIITTTAPKLQRVMHSEVFRVQSRARLPAVRPAVDDTRAAYACMYTSQEELNNYTASVTKHVGAG